MADFTADPFQDTPAERLEGETDTDAFYEEWDRFFLAFENALETCPKAEEETHHA